MMMITIKNNVDGEMLDGCHRFRYGSPTTAALQQFNRRDTYSMNTVFIKTGELTTVR